MKLTDMTDMLQHINTIFKTLTLTRNNNGEFEYQQTITKSNFVLTFTKKKLQRKLLVSCKHNEIDIESIVEIEYDHKQPTLLFTFNISNVDFKINALDKNASNDDNHKRTMAIFAAQSFTAQVIKLVTLYPVELNPPLAAAEAHENAEQNRLKRKETDEANLRSNIIKDNIKKHRERYGDMFIQDKEQAKRILAKLKSEITEANKDNSYTYCEQKYDLIQPSGTKIELKLTFKRQWSIYICDEKISHELALSELINHALQSK